MAEEDDSDEVDFYDIQKSGTVEDIIMGMEKTKISKKKKKGGDVAMEVTKQIKKPEKNSRNQMLKEKGKRKKSRSQLRF